MKYYQKPSTSTVALTMAQRVLAGSPDLQLKSSGTTVIPGQKQYAV